MNQPILLTLLLLFFYNFFMTQPILLTCLPALFLIFFMTQLPCSPHPLHPLYFFPKHPLISLSSSIPRSYFPVPIIFFPHQSFPVHLHPVPLRQSLAPAVPRYQPYPRTPAPIPRASRTPVPAVPPYPCANPSRQPSFPAFPSRSHAPAVLCPLPFPETMPGLSRAPHTVPAIAGTIPPGRQAGRHAPQPGNSRAGTRTPPGVPARSPSGSLSPRFCRRRIRRRRYTVPPNRAAPHTVPPIGGTTYRAARNRVANRRHHSGGAMPGGTILAGGSAVRRRIRRRHTVPPDRAAPFPVPGNCPAPYRAARNRAANRRHHIPCRQLTAPYQAAPYTVPGLSRAPFRPGRPPARRLPGRNHAPPPFRRPIGRRGTVPAIAGTIPRAANWRHHTVPPIGGTVPGRRRKPPRGGKPRTPIGVPKNRPPVEAPPVGGAGSRPIGRRYAGTPSGVPCGIPSGMLPFPPPPKRAKCAECLSPPGRWVYWGNPVGSTGRRVIPAAGCLVIRLWSRCPFCPRIGATPLEQDWPDAMPGNHAGRGSHWPGDHAC